MGLKLDKAKAVTNISFPKEELVYVDQATIDTDPNYAWATADVSPYEQRIYGFADGNVRDLNDLVLIETIRFEYVLEGAKKVVRSRQV